MSFRRRAVSIPLLLFALLPTCLAPAPAALAAGLGAPVTRITAANRIAATLSNYGEVGNNFVSTAASLEFPYGTGYEHLIHGGLWFGANAVDSAGAFVGVVSGCLDSPPGIYPPPLSEFTATGTAFVVRSTNLASPYYDPLAVSEEDLMVLYDDATVVHASYNPEVHRPMGILVRQESHAWGWTSLRDVLFLSFNITNTGSQPLTGAWVGLYTELASGPKNNYTCWPPNSSCSTIGGWFQKKWLQYEDSLRLIREHYCAAQPIPSGCVLNRVPYWMGVQLLTPPGAGQSVTLAAWPYAPSSLARDHDTERYAIMSAGTIVPLTGDSLQPQTGDPVELLALGPFPTIAAGDSIRVDFALVGGADEAEIHRNAVVAQRVYDVGYSFAATPALLSLVRAEGEAGHVKLEWQSADGAAFAATVQRREEPGDWTGIAQVTSDGLGRIAYEDFAPVAGHRYGYRLEVTSGGKIAHAVEVWVDIPAGPRFALFGFRPNPAARGIPAVSFSLPNDSPATLEAFDLSGRRVWSRRVEGLGAGSQVVSIGRKLAPGVYVLRLTQGWRAVTVRAVVTR